MQPLKLWGDIGVAPAIKPDPQPWVDNEITTGVYGDDTVRRKLQKDRIKKTGEIWTPMELVMQMCEAIPHEEWANNCTSCDPCFGNGQFIIGQLRLKINAGNTPLQAMETTYGVELMQDNVDITRQRVLDYLGDTPEIRAMVKENLVCHDFFTWNFEEWRPKTADELPPPKKKRSKKKRK